MILGYLFAAEKCKNHAYIVHVPSRLQLLNYLGHVLVNGPSTPLVTDIVPATVEIVAPPVPAGEAGAHKFWAILSCHFSIVHLLRC